MTLPVPIQYLEFQLINIYETRALLINSEAPVGSNARTGYRRLNHPSPETKARTQIRLDTPSFSLERIPNLMDTTKGIKYRPLSTNTQSDK